MLLFRNLPGSSWLCCKFWKRKNSNENSSIDTQPIFTTGTTTTTTTHETTTNESGQRQQRRHHRCHKFYKNLMKRSRTVDDYERRHRYQPIDQEQNLSNGSSAEMATNTEDELKRLVGNITRLLERLSDQPDDIPTLGDEVCLTCTCRRASMQTFPCGHKVLCKTCFVKTIQVALQERQLPLRCVMCRQRVVRIKQQSASFPIVVLKQREPPGSYYVPQAPSPLPPSGIRRPGYM